MSHIFVPKSCDFFSLARTSHPFILHSVRPEPAVCYARNQFVRNLIPLSGYYLCNRLGRVLLESFEEAIGRNGLNALLNLTESGHYIEKPNELSAA